MKVQRALVTVFAAIVTISACVGGGAPAQSSAPASVSITPSPEASPSPAADALPTKTPWEEEMANIQPDGARSLESALRLFALAIGPVPGIDVVPSDPGEIKTGTPALHAVRAHWDVLTPEQRQAIESALAVPDDAQQETVPEVGSGSNAVLAGALIAQGADAAKIAAIKAEMNRLRSRLAAIWGDFPNEIQLVIINNDSEMATYAHTNMVPSDPSQFGCKIIVAPPGLTTSTEVLNASIAHSVFYCGAAFKRNSNDFYGVPHWVVDGTAHFFALSETGAQFQNAWKEYMLQSHTIPLFERGWDAIGFWSHIAYTGGDVYQAFLAASAVPGASLVSPARFTAAGGGSAEFLGTWASGLYRQGLNPGAGYGPAWNTSGPSLPADLQGTFDVLQVLTNDVEVVERAPYTNIYYSIQTSADLLRFEFEGYPRLADGKGVDTTLLAGTIFCTRMGGCPPCPNDPNPQQYPVLAQDSTLAVSGGMEGTSGTISGEKLEPCPSPDVCEDGGTTADGGGPVAMIGGGVRVAQATPCPTPTPDEFCKRYRALLDWQVANQGIELTQPWAAEIARQAHAMRPLAPPEMVQHVNVYILVYETYAVIEEPVNVPIVGSDAAKLGIAFMALTEYCEITF